MKKFPRYLASRIRVNSILEFIFRSKPQIIKILHSASLIHLKQGLSQAQTNIDEICVLLDAKIYEHFPSEVMSAKPEVCMTPEP